MDDKNGLIIEQASRLCLTDFLYNFKTASKIG